MNFFLMLILLTECVVNGGSYEEEAFHTLSVPFKVGSSGETREQVFLEFHCHTVLSERNLAMNITVVSTEEISMKADKCGQRLFETSKDIKYATYLFTREWIETMLTGIDTACDTFNEYALNFTIDSETPCNGTIFFSLAEHDEDDISSFRNRSNPMEGIIPFETFGENSSENASSDISFVIDAVFMNPRLRLELEIEYSTAYTLAIGKCGLKMLQSQGNGTVTKRVLGWDETKLLRLVKTTHCLKDIKDTIDYVMSSQNEGKGYVKFAMTRGHKNLDDHPGNFHDSMELARGIPKHRSVKDKGKTQSCFANNVSFITAILFYTIYQFL